MARLTAILFLAALTIPASAVDIERDEFTGEVFCSDIATMTTSDDAAAIQIAGWREADGSTLYQPQLFIRLYLHDWAFINGSLELLIDGRRETMPLVETGNRMVDDYDANLIETAIFGRPDLIRDIAEAGTVRARIRGRERPIVFEINGDGKEALQRFLTGCVDNEEWVPGGG